MRTDQPLNAIEHHRTAQGVEEDRVQEMGFLEPPDPGSIGLVGRLEVVDVGVGGQPPRPLEQLGQHGFDAGQHPAVKNIFHYHIALGAVELHLIVSNHAPPVVQRSKRALRCWRACNPENVRSP